MLNVFLYKIKFLTLKYKDLLKNTFGNSFFLLIMDFKKNILFFRINLRRV